jgi:uncharacterized protein (TIGR00725 family)
MIQLCFAGYSGAPPKDLVEKASTILEELSKLCNKFAVLIGGYWGLMKYVVDKALELALPVVIVSPIEQENIAFPDGTIVVKPGVSYRIRSVFMVRSCNALIVLGGESGTIQEVVTAYTEGVPTYVLKSGLSSDKIELLAPYIDSRALTEVKLFEKPEELVTAVAKDVCRAMAKKCSIGVG